MARNSQTSGECPNEAVVHKGALSKRTGLRVVGVEGRHAPEGGV